MAEQAIRLVLFVCLGNICWSPIAEAVFRKLVTDQNISDNWVIDSGAVSDWNAGGSPDPRAVSRLRNHGVIAAHEARQAPKKTAPLDSVPYMGESRQSGAEKVLESETAERKPDCSELWSTEITYHWRSLLWRRRGLWDRLPAACEVLQGLPGEGPRTHHPAEAQARPPRLCVKCQQCHLPSQGRSPPFSWLAVSHLTK